jgi:hypothetical protein
MTSKKIWYDETSLNDLEICFVLVVVKLCSKTDDYDTSGLVALNNKLFLLLLHFSRVSHSHLPCLQACLWILMMMKGDDGSM